MSLKLERNLSEMLAARLDEPLKTRWKSCGSSHRFLAYYNKELVLYTLNDSQPIVQDTLKCRSVNLSTSAGFSSEWINNAGATRTITHSPTEVGPYCFMWHSFDCQLRYFPYNGRFSASFPLAYKTRSNPETQNEDHTYWWSVLPSMRCLEGSRVYLLPNQRRR